MWVYMMKQIWFNSNNHLLSGGSHILWKEPSFFTDYKMMKMGLDYFHTKEINCVLSLPLKELKHWQCQSAALTFAILFHIRIQKQKINN